MFLISYFLFQKKTRKKVKQVMFWQALIGILLGIVLLLLPINQQLSNFYHNFWFGFSLAIIVVSLYQWYVITNKKRFDAFYVKFADERQSYLQNLAAQITYVIETLLLIVLVFLQSFAHFTISLQSLLLVIIAIHVYGFLLIKLLLEKLL
ncbi:hypothetical protein [Streptococcus pacificus]|uniref:DUF3796 domain-containing protein n=1 Tax=Streptococcus pacificus TaxID=2740577 RepID=A0ABS0ZK57_9STRE|nr:hypothetical protein [Streptococcus pacificus]MBJ8326385.1 hypothetical protein [Streptococcus pacificus]